MLAEELGFDARWPVEHHFEDYALCPDDFLVLANLAARRYVGDIDLMCCFRFAGLSYADAEASMRTSPPRCFQPCAPAHPESAVRSAGALGTPAVLSL